jgi:D-alanyl-D-alanine carboxypeptidase
MFSIVQCLLTRAPALAIVASLVLSALPAPLHAASKYAAIVIDTNSGKTLFASSADAPRYPASLTKMMTLYMVFDAMKSGKISKSSRIPVSKHASSMQPTKLYLKPGQTISVENAIQALVTKSANDVAAAVAEHLGGSEAGFARMATAKARQLGMKVTTFRNGSGLPDPNQKTTARDMAILGIALREHFPNYYSYFSTTSFRYAGKRHGNHNKLLGRVQGVDGIKTGYTRASGFNLVSSVQLDGRSIVAVVMGGKTGASRDAHMKQLISKFLPKASKRDRGPMIAARQGTVAVAALALPKAKEAPVPVFRRHVIEKSEAAVAAYAPTPKADIVENKPAVDAIRTASVKPSGWVIQVASLPTEDDAKAVLQRTGAKAGSTLASATPFTERFEKGGATYFRARFAGFASKNDARSTCNALKKKQIACYAVAN